MSGASGGHGCRSDRYATVDGRFDRQVGERLKDGARRSFHNFEPRWRFAKCKSRSTEQARLHGRVPRSLAFDALRVSRRI